MTYLELNEDNNIITYDSFDDLVNEYGDTDDVKDSFDELVNADERIILWEINEDKKIFSINSDTLNIVNNVEELFTELFGLPKSSDEIEVLCETYDMENDLDDDDDDWDDDYWDDDDEEDEEEDDE